MKIYNIKMNYDTMIPLDVKPYMHFNNNLPGRMRGRERETATAEGDD